MTVPLALVFASLLCHAAIPSGVSWLGSLFPSLQCCPIHGHRQPFEIHAKQSSKCPDHLSRHIEYFRQSNCRHVALDFVGNLQFTTFYVFSLLFDTYSVPAKYV